MNFEKAKYLIESVDQDLVTFSGLVEVLGFDPSIDFVGADLAEVDFGDCDIQGYDFRSTDLRQADLSLTQNAEGANFENADVRNAILPMKLREKLMGMALHGVNYDDYMNNEFSIKVRERRLMHVISSCVDFAALIVFLRTVMIKDSDLMICHRAATEFFKFPVEIVNMRLSLIHAFLYNENQKVQIEALRILFGQLRGRDEVLFRVSPDKFKTISTLREFQDLESLALFILAKYKNEKSFRDIAKSFLLGKQIKSSHSFSLLADELYRADRAEDIERICMMISDYWIFREIQDHKKVVTFKTKILELIDNIFQSSNSTKGIAVISSFRSLVDDTLMQRSLREIVANEFRKRERAE